MCARSVSASAFLALGLVLAGCLGFGDDGVGEGPDNFYSIRDTVEVVMERAPSDTTRFPIRHSQTFLKWKFRIEEAGLYRLNTGFIGFAAAEIELEHRGQASLDHGYGRGHRRDSGWVPGPAYPDTTFREPFYTAYFAYLDTGWVTANVDLEASKERHPVTCFLFLERDTADHHEHDDHREASNRIALGQIVEAEIWPVGDEDHHLLTGGVDTTVTLRFEAESPRYLVVRFVAWDSANPAGLESSLDPALPRHTVTIRKGGKYLLWVSAPPASLFLPDGGIRYRTEGGERYRLSFE